MHLSKRITELTDDGDAGWGLFLKARAMKEAGQPVLELTIGEHDIRTDPAILDAMHRSAKAGHTGYAMVPGTNHLRDTVARRVMERTGVKTTRDNVLITPGGQAALFASHMAVIDPGDRALYVDPYYATYPGTIRAAGGLPVPVTARSRNAFQPRAEEIAARAAGARSLLLNSPNNPTGVVYSRDTLEAVARVCRDENLWLISDEVYDTQVGEGDHISPRGLPGMAQRTLVIGSMSKSHAMTGSRVGWIIAPEEVINHLTNLATHTTYGVPGYIQDAAAFALTQGDPLEAQIAAPFRRRRDIATRMTAGHKGVRLIPAQGAMYIMLDIRATGMAGTTFATRLLAEELIATLPGESFGEAARGHIRVAMTIADEEFAEAFERLLRFAERNLE